MTMPRKHCITEYLSLGIYADSLLELRQKEREHHVADWQGATQYGTQVSLNFMFDRSLALKIGIKQEISKEKRI